MLAQLIFFGGRRNRIKRSFNRRRCVGLHVPGVDVRGSAAEPDKDRGLRWPACVALTRGSVSLYEFG
jgi:hypothetical protein